MRKIYLFSWVRKANSSNYYTTQFRIKKFSALKILTWLFNRKNGRSRDQTGSWGQFTAETYCICKREKIEKCFYFNLCWIPNKSSYKIRMKLILRPIESLTLTLSGKTLVHFIRVIFWWTFSRQEVSKSLESGQFRMIKVTLFKIKNPDSVGI